MDFMTLPELRNAVTEVQRTLCAYDSFPAEASADREAPSTCDCKYGITLDGLLNRGHERGNGCPEMREVATILREMKPGELKAIQARLKKRQQKKLKRMNKAWEKERKRRAKDTSEADSEYRGAFQGK